VARATGDMAASRRSDRRSGREIGMVKAVQESWRPYQ
jgi:hypothetical protein